MTGTDRETPAALCKAVESDEPQLGAVAPAGLVSEPELVQVGEHLADAVLGVPGGFRLADLLSEEVDQDNATEVGGHGLGLDGHAEEYPFRQVVFLPPAPREVVAFLLI